MRGHLLALVVCATACGSSPKPIAHPPPVIPPQFDGTIVMGHRIGPASLGMTEAQLVEYLGPPSRTAPFDDGSHVYGWAKHELNVVVVDGKVDQVGLEPGEQHLYTERYSTATGIHFGSTELEVKVKLGSPSWRSPTQDDSMIVYCYPDGTKVGVGGNQTADPAFVGKVLLFVIGGCNP